MTPEEMDAHVQAVVDRAPPLSAEQCATISRLMFPPGWVIVPQSTERMADAA